MPPKTLTFPASQQVADAFAELLLSKLEAARTANTTVTVCLSGGSTPKLLFKTLASQHADVDWSPMHFFWGDERCVPHSDSESNFGEAHRLFLDAANIPAGNVHPVSGEIDPAAAAQEYARAISQTVAKNEDGCPAFDLMVLGMGDDGHTASIFPHQMQLLDSENICEVATHPTSGQKRVTVTGKVIRASKQVCFLVTGANKADVLGEIFSQTGDYKTYPTSHLLDSADTTFYLDDAAAAKLG